ncbi:MAG: TonB-dependent receptor [Bacteroidetes Order II. Incertae sedis bacterium]|nr:TonB-dependent receptor [Bacteroidetes Order II. bacterium]MBT5250094.1 TonB-dependent receptor [Bacteroidetes Order II. bacterium]MBT6201822.1 TonB-dependent receptor [Bacteroidetes Order II. bacterium]MBT6424264.1 TonB-dependent receptor [Bacteroidetes Order II. bacterium]MBT7401761.1 TonB-dependent receptor [Bacteroidetes Order II. bacterium]
MSPSLRLIARGLALFAVLMFIFSLGQNASAQNSRQDVIGVVTDSVGVGLQGATIVALTQADSVLTKFTTTNSDGEFRLRRVPAGDYILQVTFVGFNLHRQNFSVLDAEVNVGSMVLAEAVDELGELVVSAEHIPIVVKRDTLEFNAAAFATRPNAVVEDLLRRLPGVEVAADGTIKAQGEEVQNVLVDGKEFFGSDYKIATKNLAADAVDKVQVYDKKSDMAEFTGVDDGEEQVTINLELKEDAKQGYFGNMSGGFGDDNRYDGQASINRFSSTTQLSFLGNINNVNRQGFSFGDYINFMGGMGAMMGGGGQFSMGGGGIQLGTDLSDGFSDTFSAGLNASREFGEKLDIRSSYFASNIENSQTRSVQQQQLLGSALSANTQENSNQISDNLTHRLNLNAKYEIDKGNDFQLRSTLTASSSSLNNAGFRETAGANGSLINSLQSEYLSDGDQLGGDASLTWRKRLTEKGRSLVATVSANLNDSDRNGNLNSSTGFFDPNNVASYEEISQFQASLGNTLSQTQRISLTEPIGKGRVIELKGERRSINEDQDKTVYDLVGGAQVLNDLLSNGLDRTYTYYNGGLTFRKNWEKVYLSFGANVQESSLDGTILDNDATISNGYTHVLPNASLRLNPKDGVSIQVRYTASTREPSMNELQPFPDNSDPLNIYVGNPNLTPEYRHNTMVNLHYFDQFTFVNAFAYLSASYTEDKIARSRTIDAQLKQETMSVNTDGDWTFNGSLNFGAPIRPIGMKFNVSMDGMLSRGIEFINGDENTSDIMRNRLGLTLDNRNKEVFDARIGANFTFNDVQYSLNENLNQNYINSSYNANFTYYIGETWEVSTSMDYRVFSQDVFGASSSVPLLEASITKTLLNQRADIQLMALDLLDKNEGINFSNSGNMIQEERINSLGRYIMLKFIYRLSNSNSRGGGLNVDMIH